MKKDIVTHVQNFSTEKNTILPKKHYFAVY